jgi:hypothetical protein
LKTRGKIQTYSFHTHLLTIFVWWFLVLFE